MQRNEQATAPAVEPVAGDNTPRINAITEARREQNRRAQRVFRERRRTKTRLSTSTTPRRLAVRPSEAEVDVEGHSQKTLPPSSSDSSSRRPGDWKNPTFISTKEAAFTFASPQTLFPEQESLVPKRCTPYSDLLDLVRGRPPPAIWPHGVTATLAACLFNAYALGIDIDRIMDQHYMSPFYRPDSSLSSLPDSRMQGTHLEAASESQLPMFGSLRPSFAQVSFPHHACIDLLPLPRLREAAVMLHIRPQHEETEQRLKVDGVQELKKDVYIRQGVRFRGTGRLEGKEYVVHDSGGRHCGHPWESGSWAVAPWFARKWKFLMDV